jgi:hypothetical protein
MSSAHIGEIFTTVSVNMTDIWDTALCSLVEEATVPEIRTLSHSAETSVYCNDTTQSNIPEGCFLLPVLLRF